MPECDCTRFIKNKHLVLALCMLGQCVTCGTISILGAFTEDFLDAFKVSNAKVALTCAIAQSLFCGSGPVSLWFLKQFGYRICVCSAGILSCASFVAASFVYHEFAWITTFLGVCLGFTVNLTIFTTVVILPEYFPAARERKVAYGVVAIGAGFGFLLFPIILTTLQSIFHWRQTLQLIGAISLNILPLGVALPNRGVKADQHQVTESIASNRSDHSSLNKFQSAESVYSLFKARDFDFVEEKRSDRLSLWTNPFLYLTFLAFFLGYGAIAAFYTFVFVCFEQQGLEKTDAAFILLLMGGVSVPGRIVYAIVCPWIILPSYIQWCIVVCVCNFSIACVACFPNEWTFVLIAACVSGVTYGLIWPIHPMVIADLFREKQFPLMLSLTFFVLGIGGLIGPLIAGWLADALKIYSLALSGLGFFASAVFVIPIVAGLYYCYVTKRSFSVE